MPSACCGACGGHRDDALHRCRRGAPPASSRASSRPTTRQTAAGSAVTGCAAASSNLLQFADASHRASCRGIGSRAGCALRSPRRRKSRCASSARRGPGAELRLPRQGPCDQRPSPSTISEPPVVADLVLVPGRRARRRLRWAGCSRRTTHTASSMAILHAQGWDHERATEARAHGGTRERTVARAGTARSLSPTGPFGARPRGPGVQTRARADGRRSRPRPARRA